MKKLQEYLEADQVMLEAIDKNKKLRRELHDEAQKAHSPYTPGVQVEIPADLYHRPCHKFEVVHQQGLARLNDTDYFWVVSGRHIKKDGSIGQGWCRHVHIPVTAGDSWIVKEETNAAN